MKTDEGWTNSADGHPVFWRSRGPDAAARAVVLVVHGLAEHSGRYTEVMESLAGRGFAALALDYRGHGQSPGPRVHIEDVEQWVDDVHAVARLAAERHPGAALFVLGHSQGGLLVLRLALRSPEALAGIVVTSPFLATHPVSRPGAARRAMAAVLMRVAPRLRVDSGLDARWISRDPAVVARYVADPLVSHKVSVGWLRAVTAAQRATLAAAGSLAVPCLAMVSGADRLVDPEVTRRFVALTPPGRVELVVWDGLYHEMLNEPERPAVYERILRWLEVRTTR